MDKKLIQSHHIDFRRIFHSNYNEIQIAQETHEETNFSVAMEIYEIIENMASKWSPIEIILLNYYIRNEIKKKDQSKEEEFNKKKNISFEIFSRFNYYTKFSKIAFQEPFDFKKFEECNIEVIVRETKPQKFRPAFLLCYDKSVKKLLLLLRGTKNLHDVYTDINFNKTTFQNGFCHFGLYESAKWFEINLKSHILNFLKHHVDFNFEICGHSLGAGVASILSILWKPEIDNLKCFCFACPCTLSYELSISCSDFVFNLINSNDFASRLSDISIEKIRQKILFTKFEQYSFLQKGVQIYKNIYQIDDFKNTEREIVLYPSGKIYSMKKIAEEVFIYEDDQKNFDSLIISKTSIEDHRFYNYENNLKLYNQKISQPKKKQIEFLQ
eukprot:gene6995-11161_t